MSSEGTGNVAVVGAVVAGGVVVLAAGAVIGMGILVAQGVMWCGKKMEENVENARKEWVGQREAAYTASRANVQDMPMFIAEQAERIAAASSHLTLNTVSSAPVNTAAQNELNDAMARVRAALENAHDTTQIKADTERELVSYRLKAEIEAARGILPAAKITLAEAALQGTLESMRNALSVLQIAWQAITDAQSLSTRQERKARQLIRGVTAQLSTIDTMLRNAGKTQNSAYAKQKQEIENQIKDAREAIDTDLSSALSLAENAQQAARTLTRAVSADTLSAWDQTRRQVISLQGTLDTLTTMMNESLAIKLIDAQGAQEITRRISAAQSEAQTLIQSASATSQQQLMMLNERVAIVKEEVFRIVKARQQRQIAQTVATTLEELGFQSSVGGQPDLQYNGDIVRITVTRSGNTPDFKRDDKVVSFDISRDCNVGYDFSGYVGDTCLSEAKEVFAALRAKGIFILDDQALEKLRQIPSKGITADTLSQARFNPHFVQNKTQAELAERLKAVFEGMKFANIQQSVVGGCIDIEAFNGPTGYHVVLPPDGSAQVFKNHKDVSSEAQDPIASHVSRTLEEIPQKVKTEKKAKPVEKWQQYTDTGTQETLEY